mmetsp:Transcript_22721/g.53817  ORF Transcript_22721/g.53817 Transcript_22721/m.53817 type:complete len:876 (+) Transcript_22721:371-2998(+)
METQTTQPQPVPVRITTSMKASAAAGCSSCNRSHNSGGCSGGVCHDDPTDHRICRGATITATTKRQLNDSEQERRPPTTRRSMINNQESESSTTRTRRPSRKRRRTRNSISSSPSSSRSVLPVAACASLLLLLYFMTTTFTMYGGNVVVVAAARTGREHERDEFNHNDYDHDEYVDDYCQPPNVKWDWERLDYYELLGLVDAPTKDGKKQKQNKNNGGSSNDQSSSFLRWNGWNNQKNTGKKGLKELADTSSIDMKQIKKAYRRAAQIYHPDKATTTSGSLSVEESTARFAKIAEAYEVLSDPSKRKEYDTYLEHCYRHKKWMMDEASSVEDGPSFKERFSKLFDSVVSVDPFAVFDDLFTGGEDDDGDGEYGEYYYDDFQNDLFSRMNGGDFDPRSRTSRDSSSRRDSYGGNYGRHHKNDKEDQYGNDEYYERYSEEPSRVYQHQQNLFDPMTGEVVVRVSQTEEYRESGPSSSSSSPGGYFFRIVAQDFKQRVDTYTGDVLMIPLTHPYVQEEGHRRDDYDQQPPSPFMFGTSNSHPNQHHDDPHPEPPLESILHSWEVMTPNTRLLVSPNGKYVAGLSPDCELLIMVDDEDVQERDGIVWSSTQNGGGKSISDSSRYGYSSSNNNKNTNQCFAILKESHLIVAVGGSMGHQHPVGAGNDRILWYSDGEDNESASGSGDDEYFDYEDEFGMWHRRPRSYLAQLDNDGSLTIYSVWSLPSPSAGSTTESNGSANSRSMIDSAKDLLHGRVRAVDYGHLYYPSFPPSSGHSSSRPVGLPVVYKRCIYSTSPLGCSRVGRRLVQLSLEMYFRIKGFLARFNHATDAWLDLIYEEDDFLLGFKESVWKNGSAFGSRMASSSARFVRRVMEFFEERGL